jgi:hypothetical protein
LRIYFGYTSHTIRRAAVSDFDYYNATIFALELRDSAGQVFSRVDPSGRMLSPTDEVRPKAQNNRGEESDKADAPRQTVQQSDIPVEKTLPKTTINDEHGKSADHIKDFYVWKEGNRLLYYISFVDEEGNYVRPAARLRCVLTADNELAPDVKILSESAVTEDDYVRATVGVGSLARDIYCIRSAPMPVDMELEYYLRSRLGVRYGLCVKAVLPNGSTMRSEVQLVAGVAPSVMFLGNAENAPQDAPRLGRDAEEEGNVDHVKDFYAWREGGTLLYYISFVDVNGAYLTPAARLKCVVAVDTGTGFDIMDISAVTVRASDYQRANVGMGAFARDIVCYRSMPIPVDLLLDTYLRSTIRPLNGVRVHAILPDKTVVSSEVQIVR